jgi:hypothetical protein
LLLFVFEEINVKKYNSYIMTGAASVQLSSDTLWVTGGESSDGCVASTEFLVANGTEWTIGPGSSRF